MTAKEILQRMTLEEKASLCSGADFWHLKSVERLGLQKIMVTDGPHGLRKQAGSSDHLGVSESVKATCFPTASATACSFDRDLLRQIGEAIGEECLQEEVAVVLGPGANIKRSPLCGRNFEYVSEDPYVTGELAAALIAGVQSKNVGTSLKHYALNSQEHLRMVSDSVADERAMREIYFAGFEAAVRQSQPYTVMCSYNRINGTYASENKRVLTDILRNEWGFNGLVVTDWGAVADRVEGIRAGLDLEMPSSGGQTDAEIVAAVNKGDLLMEALDKCALRIVQMILKTQENLGKDYTYDADAHHALARKAAAESTVLLQNDGILPLAEGSKLAVIGAFAKTPRYQGAGSSRINPYKIDSAVGELEALGVPFTYAEGYKLARGAEADTSLLDEACAAAKAADVAIVFAGLPDEYESEGFDRTSLDMPEEHNRLIEAVAKANPNTIVVLQLGAPVLMPWKDKVKGIVLSYLGGEAGSGAAADVLFGKTNPSGKLAETFPLRLEDVPCAQYFAGSNTSVEYRESIFVGYRYFDKTERDVLFPFGYGFSYTSFALSNLVVSDKAFQKGNKLTVSVDVENTGSRAGAEVVQIYVGRAQDVVFRADKELKGFAKVFLAPGEKKTVTVVLNDRSFSYYNAKAKAWAMEGGTYTIMAGTSAKHIALAEAVFVEGDGKEQLLAGLRNTAAVYYSLPKTGVLDIPREAFASVYDAEIPKAPSRERPFTVHTALGDVRTTIVGRWLYNTIVKKAGAMFGGGAVDGTTKKLVESMIDGMPLRSLIMMSNGAFDKKKLNGLLRLMNGFKKAK